MKKTIISVVIFFYLALSGCMSSILRVDTVTLSPPSHPESAPISNAFQIGISVKAEDRRTNSGGWLGGKVGKRRVGHAENGFGESIAPDIAVDVPVEVSFVNAFEAGLAEKGFKVEKNSPVQLLIQIDHFFTRFKSQFGLGLYVAIADLRMKVSLIDQNGNLAYAQDITSQGRSDPAFWQDGKTAEPALNQALEIGIAKLFGNDKFISSVLNAETKQLK